MGGWRKLNEYSKFEINLFLYVLDIKDVEVIKEGKKQKLKHVRILIEITPSVDVDYTKRFQGSKFLQGLQDFFHKYIIKEDINTVLEDQLWYRALKLQKVIKEYLDFEAKSNAYEGVW